MSLDQGRKGWLGVGLETTIGSPVAITDYIPFTENTLRPMHTPISADGAYQVRNKNFNSVTGKKWGEGDVSMNLDTKLAGYFLIAGLGSVSSSNVQAGVNDHTISVSNSNTPKGLTLVSDRINDRQYYAGQAVDTLKIAAKDDLASLTAGLKGNFPITTTSGTAVTASGTLLSFIDASFAFGSSVAVADAATNLKLSEVEFNLNNNVTVHHAHGNGNPRNVTFGDLDVEVGFTLFFENTTNRDAYYNLSKQAACLEFTGAGIGGGLTESLKINMYRTRVDSFELETGLSDFFAEKGKLVLERDNANSKELDMVLRNSKTSY